MLRRNVLIFHTGGLGDFVLTWPFAVGLGRIYPQSRILYVTHQQKGDLARRVLRLEATDIEAGWHGLFATGGALPQAAQKLIESAHAIYTFLPTDPTWHQNVERLNPAARRIEIDTRITADFSGHLADKIIADLAPHAPEKSATQQMLRSIADRGVGYKPTGGSDVVIHPGSGSPSKCWPIKRYIELAARLKKTGRDVRFVIGEVELERWSAGDREQVKSSASVRECSTCLELLEQIQTAGFFVGNDSGPAHLAGIIGVPTLALFGPTNPAQWHPLGPKVHVLRHQPLSEISVDEVMLFITTNMLLDDGSGAADSSIRSTDDDD